MPPLVHYFFLNVKEIRTVILGNTFVFMVHLLSFLKENGVTKKDTVQNHWKIKVENYLRYLIYYLYLELSVGSAV